MQDVIALAVRRKVFPAWQEAEAIRALWKAVYRDKLQPLNEAWLEDLTALRTDWDDAPTASPIYGREQDLSQLTQWVVQEHCRVVGVLGIGGIGKSSLVVTLMHREAQHFKVV